MPDFLLQLGFDSLFFARIDYQDRAKRIDEKNLEVVWRGSKSLASSSQVRELQTVSTCSALRCACLSPLLPLPYISTIISTLLRCSVHLQIFTGIFPRHYDPPDGFVFEINDVSAPIQVIISNICIAFDFHCALKLFSHALSLLKDDILLFDYNVQERVDDFVAAAVTQVSFF